MKMLNGLKQIIIDISLLNPYLNMLRKLTIKLILIKIIKLVRKFSYLYFKINYMRKLIC